MVGMNDIPKAYYPPRARWYSSMFYFGSQLGRHLGSDRIKLPSEIRGYRVLLSLLVPGYAFAAYAQRTIARAVYGTYVLAAAVFIVWLGYFLSSVAFAAMISLHVSGVIFLIGRESSTMDLRWRVVSSLTAFSLVWLGI